MVYRLPSSLRASRTSSGLFFYFPFSLHISCCPFSSAPADLFLFRSRGASYCPTAPDTQVSHRDLAQESGCLVNQSEESVGQRLPQLANQRRGTSQSRDQRTNQLESSGQCFLTSELRSLWILPIRARKPLALTNQSP